MILKEMTVPPQADGQRAGDYLRSARPDLPESVLRRVFDARDVKLDGVRISRNDRLTEGSCLKIYLPDSV